MIEAIVFTLVSYLIGSIPGAVIVCKVLRLPDPRTQGSHNPGATNVLRLGGKWAGFMTLVVDGLKGAIPVGVAIQMDQPFSVIAPVMVATCLGHIYSIFLRFRGGKGVATSFGILCALNGLLGVTVLMTWLIVAWFFGFSSLAAILSAIATPCYAVYFLGWVYGIPTAVISAFILWRHRANLVRLWQGTEPKLRR